MPRFFYVATRTFDYEPSTTRASRGLNSNTVWQIRRDHSAFRIRSALVRGEERFWCKPNSIGIAALGDIRRRFQSGNGERTFWLSVARRLAPPLCSACENDTNYYITIKQSI
jgi:hypothetical protein